MITEKKLLLLSIGNRAGVLLFCNGQLTNYGSIRVEQGNAIYYTGKGLREIWKPDMNEDEKKLAEELKKKPEHEMIASDHIAVTPLTEIADVLL
ncbi:MAG: hypothetical protein FD123_2407 [Bacteroidetes bacterium]|nr:MAG: hypothetical protein FD123_2407 [Bacteroidota bacterium]